MAASELEIDTKEMCLLCYDPCVEGERDEFDIRSSLTGFKHLLRYLNVNTKELFNCSTQFLQWMEIKHEIDVQITLCGKCSLVMEEFDKLYKQYELIQFRFDKCVASLHQSMKSGDESDERVREFKRQMRPNKSVDLINASIATNLRTQTFNKCSLKLQNVVPRVAVQDITPETRFILSNPIPTDDNDGLASVGNNIEIVSVTSQNANNNQLQNKFIGNDNAENDVSQPYEVDESKPFENVDSLDELADEIPIFVSPLKRTARLPAISPPRSQSQKRKRELRKRSESTVQSVVCEICQLNVCKATIRRHRLLIHPEHTLSKLCAMNLPMAKFKSKLAVILHRVYAISARNDGSVGYECCYCQNILRRKSHYKYHLVSQHQNEMVSEVSKLCSSEDVDKTCTKPQLRPRPSSQVERNKFPCKYCPYTSNLCADITYHTMDFHIDEMVLPHLKNGTCKTKCRQAAEAVLSGLKNRERQCPKCLSKKVQKFGLRRHIIGKHFDELVQDVRDYMSQDVGDIPESGGEEKDQEESPVEIEFGTENVKVEPMATLEQWDPSDLDLD